MDEGIAELKALVKRARRLVVFTGAGVSTDYGLLWSIRLRGFRFWHGRTAYNWSSSIAKQRHSMQSLMSSSTPTSAKHWKRYVRIDRLSFARPVMKWRKGSGAL